MHTPPRPALHIFAVEAVVNSADLFCRRLWRGGEQAEVEERQRLRGGRGRAPALPTARRRAPQRQEPFLRTQLPSPRLPRLVLGPDQA